MSIQIENENGEYLAHFELDCNPFKEGEIIKLDKKNLNRDMWTIEPLSATYKILKISHDVRINYGRSVITTFITTLTVTEHE